MHAAWRDGHRRVRLFCADELRPAACCIVDALHTRGYEVSLVTGPEARVMLQQPATAEILRVIWAPEGTDKQTRSRLRDALDPDAAGDVMVLASTTPRGVIDSIDAFGTPPRRSRLKGGSPRKTFLAQPTLMERKVDARRWVPSAIGATAIVAVLIGGMWSWSSSEKRPTESSPARMTEAMSPPKAAEPVLASGRVALDDLDIEDDDEEPIIFDDTPVRRKAAPASTPIESAPLDEQGTSIRVIDEPKVPAGGGMPVGSMQRGAKRSAAIDPFD
jgi:hypothetical protein